MLLVPWDELDPCVSMLIFSIEAVGSEHEDAICCILM